MLSRALEVKSHTPAHAHTKTKECACACKLRLRAYVAAMRKRNIVYQMTCRPSHKIVWVFPLKSAFEHLFSPWITYYLLSSGGLLNSLIHSVLDRGTISDKWKKNSGSLLDALCISDLYVYQAVWICLIRAIKAIILM